MDEKRPTQLKNGMGQNTSVLSCKITSCWNGLIVQSLKGIGVAVPELSLGRVIHVENGSVITDWEHAY